MAPPVVGLRGSQVSGNLVSKYKMQLFEVKPVDVCRPLVLIWPEADRRYHSDTSAAARFDYLRSANCRLEGQL